MTNRAALSAVLAAVLAVPAAAGLAETPCDLLPTTNKQVVSPAKTEDVLCNVCGTGLPVHGGRDQFGNGLDYNDGKRWECEIMAGNRGNGQCKNQTTCLPGGERFFENGVYWCKYPAVVITVPNLPPNPRESCERGLRVSISRVKDLDGLPLTNNTIRKPGPVQLLLEGDGAANGVYATIGGGISAAVGDAARRLGSTPRAACLPPNCQVVVLENLANAPTGRQTLTLSTPHGYASASVGLYIDPAAVPVVAGDVECDQPARKPWAEIKLFSSNVGPGQTIPSNQVIVTLPSAQKWTLTLHQSDLQSVSPASFAAPGPVTFSYAARPAPPPPPPPQGGKTAVIAPIQGRPAFRRCVWARLESSSGTTIVAAPVYVTP